MSVAVWRIAVEAPNHSANDLTGTGAKLTGGRWNSPGTPVVYCASSIALAVLESLIEFKYSRLPYNRFLVRAELPETVWALRELLSPPGGWDAVPSGRTSKTTGDDWAASRRSPLLQVPSVIVPEDFNILINPQHPAVANIAATTVRRWVYDPRLSFP